MSTLTPEASDSRKGLISRGSGATSFMAHLRQQMLEVLHQEVQPGDRLPSERQLAQRFGVSNVTVGRVLNDLQREGIVNRISGKGTYLRELGATTAAESVTSHKTVESPREPQQPYTWILTSFRPKDYHRFGTERWTLRASGMIERSLQSAGGRTVMTNTQVADFNPSQKFDEMLQRGINSIAISSQQVYRNDPQLKSRLLQLRLRNPGLPIVEFNYGEPTAPVNTVRYDDGWGIALATQHLLELGHRKLVFLGADGGLSEQFRWVNQRRQAFQAMVDAVPGATGLFVESNQPVGENAFYPLDGSETDIWNTIATAATDAFFNSPEAQSCTGIVAINDHIAITFAEVAKQRGLRLPQDYSLSGFDDNSWTSTLGITSIHIPIEEMAVRAVEIIQQRLREPIEDYLVEMVVRPWLLVRESTASPRQHAVPQAII